jgi:hypothetical protein
MVFPAARFRAVLLLAAMSSAGSAQRVDQPLAGQAESPTMQSAPSAFARP